MQTGYYWIYIYIANNMIGVLPDTEDRSPSLAIKRWEVPQNHDAHCNCFAESHFAASSSICRCFGSNIDLSKYRVWIMDESHRNSVGSECLPIVYSKIQPKRRFYTL